MSQIDKELLEKFNKICSRQQTYEQLSEDDEPISYSSANNVQCTINRNSASPVSSLSHSSSNASSISTPIVHRQDQSRRVFNLKNQFINNFKKDYLNIQSTTFNQSIIHSNSHLDRNQFLESKNRTSGLKNDRRNCVKNSTTNDHKNSQTNGLENSVTNGIQTMNQIESKKSIDDQSQHSNSLFMSERRASLLIERLNSNTSGEQANDKLTKQCSGLLSPTDLNDSTIPPINLYSLAELAKNSVLSDSNLSDNLSECAFGHASNINSIERNENESEIVENPFSNIKLNPFLKQDSKVKNLFKAAKEIRDSEEAYVNSLKLICEKYKFAVRKSISPPRLLDQLLQPFEIILQLSNALLNRFNHCIKNYEKTPKIANVLVELGQFLKHYADFFTKFELINNNFAELKRKHPAFREATEKFEKDPICNKLTLSHYMLKPIQRIGQYKLLIQQYIKFLNDDPDHLTHPDYRNATKALDVVTKAAEFSNERMRENEKFNKLLEIQQCIIGGYEIIKPYRRLIKMARLHKISRKIKQERLFILCNDCLIYLTILKENTYKVNHEMGLSGMRISSPDQEAFQNEILIRSSQRSIRVVTSSLIEKEEWMKEIDKQISQIQNNGVTNGERPLCLGEEAPIWIPDERVSMCQLCTVDFNLANRRHHCRACGLVICSKCSKQKHYLRYSRKKERVCDNCFETLTKHAIPEQDENTNLTKSNSQVKLSSSDPTIHKLNNDDRPEHYAPMSLTNVCKKVRRNSSNLTSLSSRSSKCSMFFVEQDEQIRDRNDEILSIMLEDSQVNEEQINKQNSFTSHFIGTDRLSDEPPTTPLPQPEFQRNLNLRQSGRKRPIPKVLTEISANERESDMAGYMLKRKGKRNWRKFWFVLKSHVLYSFKQAEDVIAIQSLPILGYTVQISEYPLDGQPANLILQLTHQNLPDLHFRLETEQCVEKWFKALKEGTGLR